MKFAIPLCIAISSTVLAPAVYASDHLDGPATSKDRVVDLSDLYAFPTPQKPGFLTIILDMYPVVAPTGHFSDKVNYTIYVRRAVIRNGDRPGFDTSDEVALHCTFITPHDDASHRANCTTDSGVGAAVKYNEVQSLGSSDGLHLFAGQRADPFFFNAVFAGAFSMKGKLVAPLEQDIMKSTNTLAVVMDVEVAKLFPANPPTLLAVSAESTTQDGASAPVRRLDRIGRPEISNITLVAHDDEPDLRDQYNIDRPFAVPADHANTYRERISKNINYFDRIDEHIDWTDETRRALTDLLVDDFLVVDIALPCEKPAYFEIERSMLTHTQHQTCGGRKPMDDIMDILYGIYAGGPNGKTISDGVNHPSMPVSTQFPYLAEPDRAAASGIKTMVLNKPMCGCRMVGEGETGTGVALCALMTAAIVTRRRRRG